MHSGPITLAFGRGDYEREIGPAGRDENKGIACAEPAENAGESGVINGAHEPAHIVAVLAAYRGLGIVNYAVHLNVFLRHHGERQYAQVLSIPFVVVCLTLAIRN